MGKIFCIFGKSASGKDTLYKRLLDDKKLDLIPVTLYTTRPMRAGEIDGEQYFFVDEVFLKKISDDGKLIEHRVYNTVHGPWHYFMADDGGFDLESKSYITIGTLESYCSVRDYFGSENVVPLYIFVEDGIRLIRSIEREMKQKSPSYNEICRRFLADAEDFSEDKLVKAGISKRFTNIELDDCFSSLRTEILNHVV